MRRPVLGLALVLGLGISDARAALFEVQGGVMLTTPPSNDYMVGLHGYERGDLFFTGDDGRQYLLTFTLLFSESGWTNTLVTPGGNLTEVDGVQSLFVSFPVTGTGVPVALTFRFTTPGYADVVNGNGSNDNASRSFFVSFCEAAGECSNPRSGDSGFLLLDDSGAGPDDDHDDWVGRFQAREVPVPDGGATLALLGCALGALGVLRRKLMV
jgi:hypothetical protein